MVYTKELTFKNISEKPKKKHKKIPKKLFFRYTSPPSAESTTSSTISQKVDSSTSATSSEAPREARPSRFNPSHPEQQQVDHQNQQGHCVLAAETPLVSSSLAASLGNLSKSRYYI